MAGVQLDNTEIRAPFSGVVIAKSAQPGEMISPISAGGGFTRTGIGTIVDMDSLEIEVDVNESFINRVARAAGGGDAERVPGLEDPGRGDRDHPHRRPQQGDGEGARRDPVEGPAHRPRHGRARGVPGRAPAPGRAAAPPGVLVPRPCAAEGKAGSCSWSPTEGAAAPVTLGQSVGSEREVLSGLAGGERVVVSPPASLGDGDAVKVAEGG